MKIFTNKLVVEMNKLNLHKTLVLVFIIVTSFLLVFYYFDNASFDVYTIAASISVALVMTGLLFLLFLFIISLNFLYNQTVTRISKDDDEKVKLFKDWGVLEIIIIIFFLTVFGWSFLQLFIVLGESSSSSFGMSLVIASLVTAPFIVLSFLFSHLIRLVTKNSSLNWYLTNFVVKCEKIRNQRYGLLSNKKVALLIFLIVSAVLSNYLIGVIQFSEFREHITESQKEIEHANDFHKRIFKTNDSFEQLSLAKEEKNHFLKAKEHELIAYNLTDDVEKKQAIEYRIRSLDYMIAGADNLIEIAETDDLTEANQLANEYDTNTESALMWAKKARELTRGHGYFNFEEIEEATKMLEVNLANLQSSRNMSNYEQ